jgi:hypothetical protein
MSDSLSASIVTVLLAVIGVAIIAVLVSPKASTSAVIGAGSKGFSGILGSALSPITGGSFTGGGAYG